MTDISDSQHMVEVEDDALHDLEPDVPFWSESGMFTSHDPATGISAYLHFALLDTRMWQGVFALYLPNGELLVSRTFGLREDGQPMNTGQATLEPVVPRQSWRMRYDGVARRVLMADLAEGPLTDGAVEQVQVDLVGEATCPAYGSRPKVHASEHQSLLGDIDFLDKEAGGTAEGSTPFDDAKRGSGLHVEQSMKVTGELRFGGSVVSFDGVGHRDHSCGTRNRSHMWRESWINGSFPSGRTFHALQVFVTGRPTYFMGYVWSGEKFHEMSDYVGPLLSGPMGQPWVFDVSFDADGAPQQLRGELLGVMPASIPLPQGSHLGVAPNSPLSAQCPTRWTWGEEVGYGWVERVFTPRGWVAVTASAAVGGP
jgi:hypothetical protein